MSYADDIEWHVCPSCGIRYAAPAYFFQARRSGDQGVQNWFCPNGHRLSQKETEVDRLRRERDGLIQDAARIEDEHREAIRAERKKTKEAQAEARRLLNRATKGVCPCCNRSFVKLAQHIKTKHPGVVPLKQKVLP